MNNQNNFIINIMTSTATSRVSITRLDDECTIQKGKGADRPCVNGSHKSHTRTDPLSMRQFLAFLVDHNYGDQKNKDIIAATYNIFEELEKKHPEMKILVTVNCHVCKSGQTTCFDKKDGYCTQHLAAITQNGHFVEIKYTNPVDTGIKSEKFHKSRPMNLKLLEVYDHEKLLTFTYKKKNVKLTDSDLESLKKVLPTELNALHN